MYIIPLLPALPASGQDYFFRRYSNVDGLVNEVVLDIMEDSYGFLWLSTASGVSRFDGKNFKNYGFTEGLQNLVIIKIYEDNKRRLWIGTANGIAELKGGHFIMHNDNGPGEVGILSFGEMENYGLIAFTDNGTYRYNDSMWIRFDLLPGYKSKKMCSAILETDSGVYMNYEDAIVFHSKNSPPVAVLKDSIADGETFCNGITEINGKVYAGVRDKIYELVNGKAKVIIDNIPIDRFFNFVVDDANVFWVNISGKGLYRYKVLTKNKINVSRYLYDSNTSGYPFIDNQKNLWISSYEGLIKVGHKSFEDITPAKVSVAGKRLILIPGVDKEIIVSDASGLHILRDKNFERISKPASYKDEISYGLDVVEGYAQDSRKYSWMMTRQRKMLCWNGSRLMDYSALLIKRSTDYIRNLAVNPVNNMVFICDDSTLLYGNEKKFSSYADRDGNSFSKTTTVLFTRNGIGLVNVFSKGVYFITRENKIMQAPPELNIIDKGSYTYFFEDRDGSIWISNAGKGLVHFSIDQNDYSIKDLNVLTTDQGLPSNKISHMTFDSEGNKWVSCSNGLVVLKQSVIDKKGWDIYNIGRDQNFNLSSPVAMTTDNYANVWLSSLDKLIRVDARKLQLKKAVPGMVIEKVMLNMKETDWLQYTDSAEGYFQLPVNLKLDYSQNSLGIEFSGVSLHNADYFEYSYQLEPLDKTWSNPSQNKIISLVKLGAGNYVFKVRTRGMGTEWSKPGLFSFTINPPVWETWWFRMLVICVAAAIIILIYRNRVGKIQEQANMQNQLREMEMKALKAQMNPHFIHNALNSIQSLIADERKTEAINYIGTFSRLLRHVLEYSDSNVITLEKELQTLRLYIQLESLRLNINLEYSVTTDENVIAENEKVPPLILQPFVENALWHGLSRKTGNKQLNITVSQKNSTLICTVEDNGIGRANAAAYKKEASEEMYTSKGIEITIQRLKDFNKSKDGPVEFFDLLDDGQPSGTKAVISIHRH